VNFIGRENELKQLKRLLSHKKPSLVVCYGRRRIGKSALIREFGKSFPFYIEIQGLAPNSGMTNTDQLKHFMSEFTSQTSHPLHPIDHWRQGFQLLSQYIGDKKCLLFLDEISWMGAFDPTFTALLKVAWDTEFKKNPGLVLVLCGSVSSWINDNILKSKDFFGRISLEIPLRDLSIPESNEFWGKKKTTVSAREKLRFLSITGGVPRYLEEMNPSESADKNIKDLCFTRNGILFSEFEKIFNDVFSKRATTYRAIVETLTDGSLSVSEICKELKIPPGGKISSYLKDLILAGFLSSEPEWNLKKPKSPQKITSYRISDNYLRFYLKYIFPNRDKIEKNLFKIHSFSDLKGSEAMVGLQFESLILNNLEVIFDRLNLNGTEVLRFGPYHQRKTLRTEACQIDLLIQTKHEIYICELKTSQQLSPSVMDEVEKKIQVLNMPKRISVRKVLIHCSELSDGILEEDYFDQIISFKSLLSG
jgi:AAA+ ATPase superfamily predicted ATPase